MCIQKDDTLSVLTENIIFGLIRSHPTVKTVGFPARLNCKKIVNVIW